MESHVKSINTDKRSKKKLKFASNKERSKRASADVYRSYKRKIGVTSAATREEIVHNPNGNDRFNKRQKKKHRSVTDDDGRTAVVKVSSNKRNNKKQTDDDRNNETAMDIEDSDDDGEQELALTGSTFAEELDVAIDRNASEIFGKFHREVWGLVRSLPETLHHSSTIIDLMVSYLLSPVSKPERPSDLSSSSPTISSSPSSSSKREEYIINHATTDILHLLSVLARDLRHEMHDHLHSKILPRIFTDLLNPPLPPPDSGKQPIPIDVTIVEAAFRAISYILKYDSNVLSNEFEDMRKYYGTTLANKRELIRRLAGETFAPMIRKLNSKKSIQKHLKRVLKALASTDNGQPTTHTLKRTQDDGVDGISKLIFQLTKGVPGKMHSKGHNIVSFLIGYCRSIKTCNRLIFAVTSNFLTLLCFHIRDENSKVIVDEIITNLESAVTTFLSLPSSKDKNSNQEVCLQTIYYMVELLAQISSTRQGSLLCSQNDNTLKKLLNTLESIFVRDDCFNVMPNEKRNIVLSQCCSIWIKLQDRSYAAHEIKKVLTHIFVRDEDDSEGSNNKKTSQSSSMENIRSASAIVSEELLSKLTAPSTCSAVGMTMVAGAAQYAEKDEVSALLLILPIASRKIENLSDSDEYKSEQVESPGLFYTETGTGWELEAAEKKQLLSSCYKKISKEKRSGSTIQDLRKWGVAMRCAPFLTLLSADFETDEESKGYHLQMSRWILNILQLINEMSVKEIRGAETRDCVIAKGLGLEALGSLLESLFSKSKSLSITSRKMLSKAQEIAESLLFAHPKSIWSIRGAASIAKVLKLSDLVLDNSLDKLFEVLMPNLRSPNHFLRLHTLEILVCLPKKSYVTDHADLQKLGDGDLDEDGEYSSTVDSKSSNQQSSGPKGICDIIETLLKLERLPVCLPKERVFFSLFSKVEMLGRTGKLPIVYAETAANYMLGVFHVKFSPLWEVASRALLSLANSHEENIWPILQAELVRVMSCPPTTEEVNEPTEETQSLSSITHHHTACTDWEKSSGKDVSIFCSTCFTEIDGIVPRYHTTDAVTVMESVWKVAEEGQQLFAQNSRVIVPTFLKYLHCEYFSYYFNDPEMRELNLDGVSEVAERIRRGSIDRSYLQRRLKCFLRVFAVVDGPKQLVRHTLLQKIFTAFLGNQDPAVSQLALSALMKFKSAHLVSCSDNLKDFFQKGRLRNAMLNLKEDIESGKISEEHRQLLVPLLSRILFGRLTAKGAKSAKDSPAARRAAIVAFLSSLCKSDTELFSLVYLMARAFIPKDEGLKAIETQDESDRRQILKLLLSIQTNNLQEVPAHSTAGFLHLLETVVSQLGHRLVNFVPHFASIIVGLCKFAAVQCDAEDGKNGDADLIDEKVQEGAENEVDVAEARNDTVRMSSIRTLCYNRLSELFLQFGGSIDFSFLSESLWEALENSVKLLPEMVVKSEKSPALLTLLHTLSTEPQLFALLDVPVDPASAVMKCIQVTSQASVINTTLSFIENLLTLEDTDGDSQTYSTGRCLVQKHLPLLLERFASRLTAGGPSVSKIVQTSASSKGRPLGSYNSMWRRELRILLLVSEAIGDHESSRLKEKSIVLEQLCTLLLVFLDSGKQVHADDRMNVIGILKGILSHLDKEAIQPVFLQLSKSLSPCNAKIGIESLQVRESVAFLFTIVGNTDRRFKSVAVVINQLAAVHRKRVDEIDFEAIIPVLNKLSSTSEDCDWILLGTQVAFDRTLISPIINYCFHFLHINDAVISRAAFNALKSVLTVASARRNRPTESQNKNEDIVDEWDRLLEGSIIPLVKAGLHCREVSVRRYYVLLVREIAMKFEGEASPHLLGDLGVLCNDDNLDLDFFVNITHVQIHRRARGLTRLRKLINETLGNESSPPLVPSSVSNIILPLIMHPVFECDTKAEETYALEAIATIGAIARCLPWKKYHATLWTVLTQFDRHPSRERYMLGLLCALIDGFHFELMSTPVESDAVSPKGKTSVWRALENRVIPKIESLLTKENVDKKGNRVKTIRAALLLALLKLYQRFPESFFESRLSRILAVVCDALASKDSDVRDTARNTLGKIVVSMDLKYLSDVIREVTITLHEGYKLHVRAATIHTILQMLSAAYTGPSQDSDGEKLYFDKCVPALMNVIQDDLFGEANERRESRETNVRYVKEAGGTKSINSVEIVCRMIKFKPSDANRLMSVSSVHCVVSPFLERLRLPDVDATTIKKVREILSRVVVGLSNNSSVESVELLPFVFATLQPFIDAEKISSLLEKSTDLDDDDDFEDHDASIRISGSGQGKVKQRQSLKTPVVEWRPSILGASGTARDATEKKREGAKELVKVLDGASAPKLTGTGRHGAVSGNALKSPASISAVVFGLNLLNSNLKSIQTDAEDTLLSMMDPFVSLLTACVCHSNDVDVLVVAFKCILALLRFELPAFESYSKLLGPKTLDFLTSSGSSLNQNQDLIQACFKTLAYLINTDRKIGVNDTVTKNTSKQASGEDALASNIVMPLNSEQMKVLITTIQVSLAESEQHNPALALIKAIMSRKYISPEFYDLMDSMLELVVRSQKSSLRQQSGGIFIRFLLDFPMHERRFEQHLKQAVANTSYEHQEGRMSAINLLASLIEKMPEELLNAHAHSIFLPLVMQKVNDNSKECRNGVEKCLILFLTRCSAQVLRSCHDYTTRWSKSQGPLLIASLQVFGLFVETCTDFLKKNDFVTTWVLRLNEILESNQSDWEVVYFSTVSVEKLSKKFGSYLQKDEQIFILVIDRMVDHHPWIKLATSRILKELVRSEWANSFFSNNLGILFKIVRNLCFQLGSDEKEQNEELSELDIKILTSIVPIICEQQHLCFSQEDNEKGETSDPVLWLLKRLSGIAKAKGTMRRMAVFKCFAAFATKHTEIVAPYLELMLEPLHRSTVEASNEAEDDPVVTNKDGTMDIVITEASLARDIIHMIEETSTDASQFLKAYAAVKTRAMEKKEERKSEAKVEAIRDPQAFAVKRMKKQEREKQRKKRRVEERRRGRGATSKRRHMS